MHDFQIRISSSRLAASSLVWAAPWPSTFRALCQARSLAAIGDILEVWRDEECVHREVVADEARYATP